MSAVLSGGRVAGKMVEYVDVTLSIKKLAPNNGRLSINHIKQAFGGLIKSRPDLKDATFKFTITIKLASITQSDMTHLLKNLFWSKKPILNAIE